MKKSELKEMIKAAFLSEKEDEVVDPYMAEGESVEEDLDEMLARLSEEEIVAEAEEDLEADLEANIDTPEGDEEVDVEVDAEEEAPAKNDSIVIDKKIVSLSSLPGSTRKILDTLETLRAQAEEFGDQKFMTQVGNTITFFTRDFVVAGDAPNPQGIEETLVTEDLTSAILSGMSPEGLEMLKAAAMKLQTSPEALINGLGMVTGTIGGAAAGIKALTSEKVFDFVNKIFGKKDAEVKDAEVKTDAMDEGDESSVTKMEAELELESLNEVKRMQKLAGLIK